MSKKVTIAWAASYSGPSETVCGGPMPNGKWWSPFQSYAKLLYPDPESAGRASLALARERLKKAEALVARLEKEFG